MQMTESFELLHFILKCFAFFFAALRKLCEYLDCDVGSLPNTLVYGSVRTFSEEITELTANQAKRLTMATQVNVLKLEKELERCEPAFALLPSRMRWAWRGVSMWRLTTRPRLDLLPGSGNSGTLVAPGPSAQEPSWITGMTCCPVPC